MIREIFALIVIISFSSCTSTKLSKKAAIELAENFILEQGYTDENVNTDSTKIPPEFTDRSISKEEIISLRFNSLKSEAAFYKKGLTKWTVGFAQTNDSNRFRVVKFSRRGKNIRMIHQDLVRTN